MNLIERLRACERRSYMLPKSTRDLIIEAADELEGFETSFDLRWRADMRAIKRWQSAGKGRDLIWPDHTDLVVWLMGEVDRLATDLSTTDQLVIELKGKLPVRKQPSDPGWS